MPDEEILETHKTQQKIEPLKKFPPFLKGFCFVLIGNIITLAVLLLFLFLITDKETISSPYVIMMNIGMGFSILDILQVVYIIPLLIYLGVKKQWSSFWGVITSFLVSFITVTLLALLFVYLANGGLESTPLDLQHYVQVPQ